MTRVLAVADEVVEPLYGEALGRLRPDLVVSCGDLPFDYLEYLVTRAEVPLVYVPGNHDPDVRRRPLPPFAFPLAERPVTGPEGCDSVDGTFMEIAGLRVAGLGGCLRYNDGPNQYTDREMGRRARRLEARGRLRGVRSGRGLDLLVTHAPPLGLGDEPDLPHRGFAAFHRLVRGLTPRLMLHGHIHPYGQPRPDRRLGETVVVNTVGFRMLEV